MASASVYYKFRAQRELSRVTFDGTGISVWELKREIILQNKMGKGMDFDLAVYSQDTEEEYKDDNYIIPRSSQVIVRRLPPARPGKGSAAQYVADLQASGPNANVVEQTAGPSTQRRNEPMYRGPMTKRFDGSDAQEAAAPAPDVQSIETDEASKIAAMFQASSAQWDETQERMSQATYRDRPGMPFRARPPSVRPPPNAPTHDRPPPVGYICFRCGTKGHWIHDCPTNDNREFDNKPRFKRTTGIPKSMLKTVEAPTDGSREGVMVTADGSYVVAQVDSASWARNQAYRQKRLTKSDIYSSVPKESELACSICSKLLRDAVRTPCCSVLACEECITNHLLEHEFKCPECDKRIKDLTELKRDDDVRKRVHEYVDSEMDTSEKKLQEAEKAALEEEERVKKESEVVEEDAEPAPEKAEDKPQETQDQDWDPRPAQQIVMMLSNPQLPPPMRMQLQMQLNMLRMQFLQRNGTASQQHALQQQGSAIGAHNAVNPFMHAGNPLLGMGMANAMQTQLAQPFRPAAPLSHHESAYMRLPVNPMKRAAQHEYGSNKRERPADFLELGSTSREN